MPERITNEQREAIVRKAVAERDALLAGYRRQGENMIVNMDAEARASLRHYLSAAMIFPSGPMSEARVRTPEEKAHGDRMYERVFAAFDEWFSFQGAASSPEQAGQMRDEFNAWVQDRGCDTDGAWSAWQAAWSLRAASSPEAADEIPEPERRQLTLEQSLAAAQVCCGDYANCHRACTPRGRWQASNVISEIEREFVALEDLPAFIRRLQDEARASRALASAPAGAGEGEQHAPVSPELDATMLWLGETRDSLRAMADRANQLLTAHCRAALAGEPAVAADEGRNPPGFVKPDNARQVFFYEQDFYVLSNFSAFNLRIRGMVFPTSEHAYHYAKFDDKVLLDAIQAAPSAHEAFKIAERNKHRRCAEWDEIKVAVMREILRTKVAQHEYVRRKLLATGDRELIEDSWRDDFWGWGPNRNGQNMLGKLWMEIRSELRAASQDEQQEKQQ